MNTETHDGLPDINRFISQQQRRDRRDRVLLSFFSGMLLLSLLVASMAYTSGTPFGQVLLPASTSVLAAILLLRQWRSLLATQRHYRAMSLPTTTAIGKLADAAMQRIREARMLMLAVSVVMLPLFVLTSWQMVATGKMSMSDAISFLVLVLVATLTVLGVHRHRIRNQLEPQLDALQNLRRQLD